jgi:AcrR family transcriptional regulator
LERPVPRARYHHGDLRRALIAAARRLIEREGPRGTTLRAVARATEVTPSALYHHFEDHDALLAALATDGFAELGEAMQRGAAQVKTDRTLDRLQGAGIAYVRFAVRNPALFRLMFSGMLEQRSRYPSLQHSATETFQVLQQLLGGAPASSSGRVPHPVALTAWSTVHGLATLAIEGRLGERLSERRATQIARSVTDVLGVGLRRAATPRTP